MSREKRDYADGSSYEGEMKDGKRHGEGIWVRSDGSEYTGQWTNDKPEGFGTFVWPNGRKFQGYWKSGKRHGKGIEVLPSGKKIEGAWEEGVYIEEKSAFTGEEFSEKEVPPKKKPVGRKSDFNSESLKKQGKGFFAALIDTSFSEMVTPKIIRILFIIGLIGIALGSIGGIISALAAFAYAGTTALLSIIAVPIGAVIGVIFLRVYMELIILLFNIYDKLNSIDDSLKR